MAKLTGQTIADSYDQLLIVDNASGVSASLQAIEAGDTGGSASSLKISTSKCEVIPASNSTSLFEVSQADGTAVLSVDTTNARVGIGTASPSKTLHVAGEVYFDSFLSLRTTDDQANRWLLYTHTDDMLRINYNGAGNDEIIVDTSGNVGIGTDPPARTLDVTGTGRFTSNVDFGASIYVADGSHIFLDGGSNTYITQAAADEVAIITGNVERIRVDSAGYVGIGTVAADPSYLLDVETSAADWIASFVNTHASTPWGLYLKFNTDTDDNTQNFIRAVGDSTTRFTVYSDGDVHTADVGELTSDENLKTNITDASSKLEDINKLRVRNFEWTEEYHPNKVGEKKIGFIAQEFEEVFPSLVRENESPLLSEVEQGIKRKSIKMALTPMLVKAIQELSAKVEALENNNKQGDSNNEQEEPTADSGDNGGDASGESSGQDSGGVEADSSDSASSTSGTSETSESSSDDGDQGSGSSGGDSSVDSEGGSGGDDSAGSE